ncbi:MAG: hypothetical protein LUG99_07500 [Lachnospiraceae bacterium]|nr:hypothetical protein [Lachnospiraceae bacterium]
MSRQNSIFHGPADPQQRLCVFRSHSVCDPGNLYNSITHFVLNAESRKAADSAAFLDLDIIEADVPGTP